MDDIEMAIRAMGGAAAVMRAAAEAVMAADLSELRAATAGLNAVLFPPVAMPAAEVAVPDSPAAPAQF